MSATDPRLALVERFFRGRPRLLKKLLNLCINFPNSLAPF